MMPTPARRAVLALESIEHADDQLGTVVMGSAEAAETPVVDDGRDGNGSVDPEGVSRQVVPRVLAGGADRCARRRLVVGGGALVFGADGWQLAGAAVAGAMLFAVFGAIWFTFAGVRWERRLPADVRRRGDARVDDRVGAHRRSRRSRRGPSNACRRIPS